MIYHLVQKWGQHRGAIGSWRRLEDSYPREYRRLTYELWEGAPHSGILGDKRHLPEVNNMIDWACGQTTEAHDIIMLTNSDSWLVSDTVPLVSRSRHCYSRRVNFPSCPNTPMTSHDIKRFDKGFSGVDLIAFETKWWYANGDKIPTLYVGCEGWDWVFKFMISNSGGKESSPLVYHQDHGKPLWLQERDSPAGRHNRKACVQWALGFGWDKVVKQWPSLKRWRESSG